MDPRHFGRPDQQWALLPDGRGGERLDAGGAGRAERDERHFPGAAGRLVGVARPVGGGWSCWEGCLV